jgi:hypothetical protein
MIPVCLAVMHIAGAGAQNAAEKLNLQSQV